MFEKRACVVVRRQKAHHVRPDVRIARTGAIDVLRAPGWLLQQRLDWRNRAQFVGVAAIIMRRILVNHARDRAAAKRGGGVERVSLTVAVEAFDRSELDLVSLHEALERLTALEPRASRIVELKF